MSATDVTVRGKKKKKPKKASYLSIAKAADSRKIGHL